MIDLAAIRARNEQFKRDLKSWYGDEGPQEDTSAAAADIDDLLAEVERLRTVVRRVDDDFGGMHVELRDAVGTVVTCTTLREHLGLRA